MIWPRRPGASDKPSDYGARQYRTEHDVLRHPYPSDLRRSDPMRRHQTKPASMVRRRSTVRFRNGAPVQRTNSNTSNGPWGPFRGPSSSHIEPCGASVCHRSTGCGPPRSAELGDMGGSVIYLLDGAEDHRRSALDRPAHQVPGPWRSCISASRCSTDFAGLQNVDCLSQLVPTPWQQRSLRNMRHDLSWALSGLVPGGRSAGQRRDH